MTSLSLRRSRGLRALSTCAILGFALIVQGCAAGPKEDTVAEENAQQRVFQQTISQLRKNMDETRLQRDDIQEKYYKAERELETAHRELTFLESRIRIERELGDARSSQLVDLQNQFLQMTAELRQSRERVGKLERDQTSMRAAFDQDQMKVAQLEGEAVVYAGEIQSLKAKLGGSHDAWELERRTIRNELQAREDEIAVLQGKLAQSEAVARDAVAAGVSRGGGSVPSAVAAGSSSATPARAHRAGAAEITSATVANGDTGADASGADASESNAVPLWKRKAKEALSVTMTRFGTFIENPGQNWRSLAHPAPILFVFFALVMPLILFFSLRRRLRRRSVRRHAAQVAQAAQLAHDAAPTTLPTSAPRHARSMPSVAIPRKREIIPTSVAPISPQSAGSVAATLDAVLGGDPISTPSPKRSAGNDDEDDLLGDLRDIVQKGLS